MPQRTSTMLAPRLPAPAKADSHWIAMEVERQYCSLEPRQRAFLESEWRKLDWNGDGQVSFDELVDYIAELGISRLGLSLTKAQIHHLFVSFDLDKNDGLDFWDAGALLLYLCSPSLYNCDRCDTMITDEYCYACPTCYRHHVAGWDGTKPLCLYMYCGKCHQRHGNSLHSQHTLLAVPNQFTHGFADWTLADEFLELDSRPSSTLSTTSRWSSSSGYPTVQAQGTPLQPISSYPQPQHPPAATSYQQHLSLFPAHSCQLPVNTHAAPQLHHTYSAHHYPHAAPSQYPANPPYTYGHSASANGCPHAAQYPAYGYSYQPHALPPPQPQPHALPPPQPQPIIIQIQAAGNGKPSKWAQIGKIAEAAGAGVQVAGAAAALGLSCTIM